MEVQKSLGLVLNVPHFFADTEFQSWLNDPRNCVMTWHKKGQPVNEFSDVVVLVDPSLAGDGTDSDMPESMWEAIVEACRNTYPDLASLPESKEHVHVRLTNIKTETSTLAQLEEPVVDQMTIKVAVIGECQGGGVGIQIQTVTLPRSGYEEGEHYAKAIEQSADAFETFIGTMDENDPGAHLVLGLKKETNLSALVSHWEVKAGTAAPNVEHPPFAFNLKSQCETNDQVYLDIERLNDSSDDPDMMSAIFEIGTDPVTSLDSPVVHLSGGSDDKLVSVFQRGNKLHLRLETGVTMSKITVGSGPETTQIIVLE